MVAGMIFHRPRGALVASALALFQISLSAKESPKVEEMVGRTGTNRFLTPTHQVLTPTGRQVELPGLRPQALALSPDGKILVTSGKTNEIVVIDPPSGLVWQRMPMPAVKKDAAAPAVAPSPEAAASTQLGKEPGAQLSLTGLAFSPDGTRLFASNVSGNVKVFGVDPKTGVVGMGSFALPEVKGLKRKQEIPAGLAVSPDGKRLYVAGNLSNQLLELDAATGASLRAWPVGVAPYEVALTGGKAYVSNSGGRMPKPGDLSAPAGRGTTVRVDALRQIANEGSVTVIDLAAGKVKTEVGAEMHASALAVSPDGKYVVVANTGADTLTVIETKTESVVEKIFTRQTPADLFGAQPNAIAFEKGGKRIFVANGTQNAVAVVTFDPKDQDSKVTGLIPVGWFPGALAYDAARKSIYVANIKGQGAIKNFKPGEKVKLGVRDFFGTVSLVPVPTDRELAASTTAALENMRYPKLAEAKAPAREGMRAKPVPERVGEPSVFKHVVYIIKENRTYDQILGDVPEGNGSVELCIFGEKVTPNQHKLARDFVLLDNTYCAGLQSADGHQWTDSGIANGYMERQVTSGFPRSYPGGKGEDGQDALAWSSSGFIWDNALAHGKTFRNYGEWMLTDAGWKDKKGHKDAPTWLDYWTDYKAGTGLMRLASKPAIETLRAFSKADTVGWDLNVPDVVRVAAFIKELKDFEARGTFPNLTIIFLPNDHTGGTRGKSPTPAAQVADNDLAMGMIVEALSASRFWPELCVFAIEDDPQAGWDHVSGYRTTCYVASAYTKRRQTISTQYNQTSVMRTMELILGLPPMNQLDAVATPMSDCFTDKPNLAPWKSVPALTPLDTFNAEPKKISDPILKKDAQVSARLPFDEMDRCPEDVLNRILWHAQKGTSVPFPQWAVKGDDD